MLSVKTVLRAATCSALFAAVSFGATYNGVGYLVSNADASNATQAQLIADSGDVNHYNFTVSGLNFNSNGSTDYQALSYLTSLGSLVGTPTYSGSVSATTSLSSGNGSNQTGFLYEFSGSAVFNSGSFTIAHDDGVTVIIGGNFVGTQLLGAGAQTIVNLPGASSAVTTTVTYTPQGPGAINFEVIYGECCGAPAVLTTTLVPASTPEPTSVVLFGTTLFGIGTLVRRRFKKVA
jgi:hypothetical protein